VGAQYSIIAFTILVCVLEIVIAVTLFQGARMVSFIQPIHCNSNTKAYQVITLHSCCSGFQRNATKCTLWFRIHCVLLFLGILFSVITILIAEERIILGVACLIGLLYQAYSLWIVRAFIHELNSVKFSSDDDEDQGQPLQEIRK